MVKAGSLSDMQQPDSMVAEGWLCPYYHAKVITRRFASPDGATYGWAYVGSHNLSPNAWGRPVGHDCMQCGSYELGVLLLTPRGTGVEEAQQALSFQRQPVPFRPEEGAYDGAAQAHALRSYGFDASHATLTAEERQLMRDYPAVAADDPRGHRDRAGAVQQAALPARGEEAEVEEAEMEEAKRQSLADAEERYG